MRLAFFGGTGEMSLGPLRALAERHQVVAVVQARRPARLRTLIGRQLRRVGLRPPDPLQTWARASGVPLLAARSGRDPRLAARLGALAPELACISGFPWILGPDLLGVAALGAVNLHPSLLPRHRGPLPLFWVYHRDDRSTGVTVHWAIERPDAGPIVAQEVFPLPRGRPVDRLYRDTAACGARLLAGAVERIAGGTAERVPQRDDLATPAPRVRPGTPMVDFAGWGSERVWHFLAGVFPHFYEPLHDGRGRLVCYGSVQGFETGRAAATPGPPGMVLERDGGWTLCCRDGVVLLGPPAGNG